jgi:hypothetical protein
MAVAPLTITPQQAFSEFDFSPLARLGDQMRQQKQADTLASMGDRYGVSPAPAGVGTDQYGRAISAIESGGRYDELGPVTKTGDRAYGKYQVMGENIPEWTRAALGRSLTPQQYLSDTAAQEAVFKHQFGQYVQKYGPSGAARAWFAGEGGMNNPNARDQLGTSVSEYERRFNAGLR